MQGKLFSLCLGSCFCTPAGLIMVAADAVAAAGAIPPLVQLLGSGSPADVRRVAAVVLRGLADCHRNAETAAAKFSSVITLPSNDFQKICRC
jgi:hypothetical protein